jgi:hypothetical protein
MKSQGIGNRDSFRQSMTNKTSMAATQAEGISVLYVINKLLRRASISLRADQLLLVIPAKAGIQNT